MTARIWFALFLLGCGGTPAPLEVTVTTDQKTCAPSATVSRGANDAVVSIVNADCKRISCDVTGGASQSDAQLISLCRR